MARKKGLVWTEKQVRIRDLLQEGKKWDEVKQLTGASRETIGKVAKATEAALRAKHSESLDKGRKTVEPPRSPGQSPADPAYQTRYQIDTSRPQTVGELQILPEDWRISQHGAFLMLDTFHLTKEDIGYEGTMGQFMVDIFRFYRYCMQHAELPDIGPALETRLQIKNPEEEDSNGRGEETSNRGGISDKGGSGNVEEAGEEE